MDHKTNFYLENHRQLYWSESIQFVNFIQCQFHSVHWKLKNQPFLKKNVTKAFYGQDSTVLRLQSHKEETVYLLPQSPQEFLILIWVESSLSWPWVQPVVPNPALMDWESNTPTTRPMSKTQPWANLHKTLILREVKIT